jgi:hypothetical protein
MGVCLSLVDSISESILVVTLLPSPNGPFASGQVQMGAAINDVRLGFHDQH